MLALPLALFLSLLQASPEVKPRERQPFVGVSVRDAPDGPVIAWVFPGPFEGRGTWSPTIRRGDNVVSINGGAVESAAAFVSAVEALSPGASMTLRVRRSPSADAGAAVPRGGPGGEEMELTVTVSDRETWSGTIGRGLRESANIPEPREGEFEAMILARAAGAGLRTPPEGASDKRLDALLDSLRRVQEGALDTNSLAPVVNAFRRPLSLDAIAIDVSRVASAPVRGDAGRGTIAEEALRAALTILDASNAAADSPPDDAAYREHATALVRHLRDNISISGPGAREQFGVIRGSRGNFEQAAGWAATRGLDAYRRFEHEVVPEMVKNPAAPPPAEFARWISGEVHGAKIVEGIGLVVVGGAGANRYDMSAVAAVYDVGGDDRYDYPGPAPGPLQFIIDLAGNDTYSATASFCGPATGIFGLSIIDDRAGNDTYRSSGMFTIGAGLFGFGILLDRAGNDTYENLDDDSGWSVGVGFYGSGMILDLAGSDVYLAQKLSQGVGGPRGFGAIVDGAGNDLYRANGPRFGSAYGTPAVYLGMSQGFGFGVRNNAAGGVGVIVDLGGDDRYEAGEFSQAGAYYFGLGIIHDVAGNDLYYGNRYGQAFAAHQAAGVLIDDAGDDTYWSMTAASQAGAWDQSMVMLVDRAGNDSYRCDGLGQGAAAQQALAILLDLGGDDHYVGRGSVQGLGGGNEYHYHAEGILSFSALFDLGGGRDFYSAGRANNTREVLGRIVEGNPGASNAWGLFVDE